jgi:hypothetical protein
VLGVIGTGSYLQHLTELAHGHLAPAFCV